MLFVDRFGRSLLLEFDKKAISDGFMAHSNIFFWGEGDFK